MTMAGVTAVERVATRPASAKDGGFMVVAWAAGGWVEFMTKQLASPKRGWLKLTSVMMNGARICRRDISTCSLGNLQLRTTGTVLAKMATRQLAMRPSGITYPALFLQLLFATNSDLLTHQGVHALFDSARPCPSTWIARWQSQHVQLATVPWLKHSSISHQES